MGRARWRGRFARGDLRSLATSLLSIAALLGWIALPTLHLGTCAGSCGSGEAARDGCPHRHGTHGGHGHPDAPCLETSTSGSPEAPLEHDSAPCGICALASLSPSGAIDLPASLPEPAARHEVGPASWAGALRHAPSLTDAPTRGPPTTLVA